MTRQAPPEEITLLYRQIGPTHVFTAPELPGLHIGSGEIDKAFSLAIKALGEHVSRICDREVEYRPELSFWDFKNHLAGQGGILPNFVIAKRSEQRAAA